MTVAAVIARPASIPAALPFTETGRGPAVVLVHGVGWTSAAFDALTRLLEPDHTVVAVDRPGYGRAAHLRGDFDWQVGALAATVGGLGRPVTLVGVSGGATLGLALAARRPEGLVGAVLHEPLVGPAATALHQQVGRSADALAADGSRAAVAAFLRGLARRDVPDPPQRMGPVVRAEVPHFAAFTPSTQQLRRAAGLALTTTLGGDLPADREVAASVVGRLCGARIRVVDGAAHLVHLDQPRAFATLIRGHVERFGAGRGGEA